MSYSTMVRLFYPYLEVAGLSTGYGENPVENVITWLQQCMIRV